MAHGVMGKPVFDEDEDEYEDEYEDADEDEGENEDDRGNGHVIDFGYAGQDHQHQAISCNTVIVGPHKVVTSICVSCTFDDAKRM